jgi:3'(2'), 5'-bisphosphate nucleotidase
MHACGDRRIGGHGRVVGVIHRTCTTAKDRRTARDEVLTPNSDISPPQALRLMDDLTVLIARACAEIAAIAPASVVRRLKADRSPVTAADEASETVILRGLTHILPGVPVVSEESTSAAMRVDLAGSFVIVDPLDGTREFIAGRDEYTINLAIVTNGEPVVGIIAAPKREQLWRGVLGHGAERLRLLKNGADRSQAIKTRRWPHTDPVATVSRSHLDAASDAFVNALGPVTRLASGSAIKFCHIAEGSADVYPRFATTCEWDVAAGHALVAAAGGVLATPQGAGLRYGRAAEKFRVPAFIAWGDPAKAAAV